MQVLFVNPNNKKFGTTEDIENTTGRTLIALGECEEVPRIRRGEKGWLEQRLAQSRAATGPSPYDTVPNAPEGIEWGVKTMKNGNVLVLKRVDGQLFYLDGVPADAPAGTRALFLEACAVNPEANAFALEKAQRAQQEQDRKDKAAGNVSVLSAMFGSKRL